jgi:hypothetical protein
VTAVNEERRTLRVGGLLTVAALIIGGLVFFFSNRRTREQNTRVYAAITRLQAGVLTQQQLMERSRQAREEEERNPSLANDPAKGQLQKKSEDLRSQIATSKAENTSDLQSQLTAVESRLQKLETEGQVAQTIIHSYEPSVCLIHVMLGFRDHATGLRLLLRGDNEQWRADNRRTQQPAREPYRRWSGSTWMFLVLDFWPPPADKSSPIITWSSLGGRTTI